MDSKDTKCIRTEILVSTVNQQTT